MFWVRTGLDKLKAWVSGDAGEYDWDEAHAKYLSFLTPGPFQRAVAGGDVELGQTRMRGPPLAMETRYCSTRVVWEKTMQRTKLFDCYWRPAPITATLISERSQAGIIACGPYSSKPVLTRNSGR